MVFLQFVAWLILTRSLKRWGFVLCFETGNLINRYWISGAQANVGEHRMRVLSKQPPSREGKVQEVTEGSLDNLSSQGFAFVKLRY